ncbi:MAG: response regulator [Chitinispirillia bacterium]|jgi:response regulator of citrate/malate metabolism
MKKSVLLVEDDPLVLDILNELLILIVDPETNLNFSANNVYEARELLDRENVALLITDVNLGMGPDGLSLASELNNKKIRPYIIIISSIPGLTKPEEMLENGEIDSILCKPFSLREFEREIKRSNVVSIK